MDAKVRKLLFAILAGVAYGCVLQAHAQPYPSRPITFVVGFPPGGPADTVARILAERMQPSLGESIIVENLTGAAGTIAATKVARAAPDGYTLSIAHWTTSVGAPAIYKLPYDVIKDFEPVSLLSTSYLWIAGRGDLPAMNLQDLIADFRGDHKASVAIVGIGSASHLCMIDLQNKTNIQMQLVPYRGGASSLQDMLAGQIDVACPEASQTLALYRGHQIKAFAVVSKERWFAAPEVPTMDEAGVSGLDISFWHGLWAPKGTPPDIIAKLNAAVVEAFADPAVQQKFNAIGHVLPPRHAQTPDGLRAFHQAEIDKWWPIIKAANVKPEL